MTIELNGSEAVAEFLEHVAKLLRRGAITAVSLEMGDSGVCRCNVVFAQPARARTQTLEEFINGDGTDPGIGGLIEPAGEE